MPEEELLSSCEGCNQQQPPSAACLGSSAASELTFHLNVEHRVGTRTFKGFLQAFFAPELPLGLLRLFRVTLQPELFLPNFWIPSPFTGVRPALSEGLPAHACPLSPLSFIGIIPQKSQCLQLSLASTSERTPYS